MTTSAEQALEPGAVVVVREGALDAEVRSDEALSRVGLALHADAMVVLTWSDAEHRHARLRVRGARDTRWVSREFVFEASDAPAERGHTLGFALASMVPPPDPAPLAVEATSQPPLLEASPPSASLARPWAIDLTAIGSVGVAGYGGGFGSEGSLRREVLPRFTLRIGGGLRIGEVPPAHATTDVVRLAAGVGWETTRSGGERPVALELRVDVLAMHYAVTRAITEATESRGDFWMPGGDLLLEATWWFVPKAALVMGGGLEVAAGTTHVVVDGQTTASIPKLRSVGDLGIRVSF